MSETGGGGGLSALAAAARGAKRPVNLFNKIQVNKLFADLTTGIVPDERSQYRFVINRNLDEIIIYYRSVGIKHQLIVRPLPSKDAHGNIIVFEYYRTEPGSNSFKKSVLEEDDENPLLEFVELMNNQQNHLVDTVEEDYTTNGSYFEVKKSRRNIRNKQQKSRRKRRSTRQN